MCPKLLPIVIDVHLWILRTAQAPTEALSYDDHADVAWLTQVKDPNESFESLPEFGRVRLRNLGAMLSGALQHKIKGGELGRDTPSSVASLIKTGRRLTGRQAARMICQHFKRKQSMTLAYTISDVCSLQWMGGSHEKVSQCKDRWGNFLEKRGLRSTRTH